MVTRSSASARSSSATTAEQRIHSDATANAPHDTTAFSRSTGLPARMGKATADLKTKVPDEVKFAFASLAHACGLSESELLRDMVVLRLYGKDAVLSMQQARLSMVAGSETQRGQHEA